VATDVTLPQLGESVTEGTITAWLVDVGDTVAADQPLFELSSDKIDTEVPAPAAGVLTEIKVQVDETVDVGTVVAVIGGDESGGAEDSGGASTDDGQDAEPAADASAEQDPAPERAAQEQGGGDAEAAGDVGQREQVAREDREDLGDGEPSDDAGSDGAPSQPGAASTMYERGGDAGDGVERSGSGGGSTEGVLASPLVRRMLAEHDLDPSSIQPSGDGGRITREDVEAAIGGGDASGQQQERRQAEPSTPSTPQEQQARPPSRPQPERTVELSAGPRERVEDLSRIRQRIAAKMMESQQSSAQLTTVQEADVTRIMRLRAKEKDAFKAREGVSLSPFVFLCRAAVLVLRRPEHQNVNAQADWSAGKVKFHDYVNLGVAVDTEKGLLVPNVKSADDLTLGALARAISTAADKARGKGKLEMGDIEGGTFTVTNTGSRGVLIDTPILNYPEVGILGTGAIKKRPVVVSDDAGDSISVRDMVYLCLTYDHRLLDGADAARFVTEVAHLVETHDWAQELGLA